MLVGKNRECITAWIEIDGGYNWDQVNILGAQYVIAYAQEAIARGDRPEFSRKAIEWEQKYMNKITEENLPIHVYLLHQSHGYTHDPDKDALEELPFTELIFYSPLAAASYFNFIYLEGIMKFVNIDLTEEMRKIETPTLIIWGRHDGLFPVVQEMKPSKS